MIAAARSIRREGGAAVRPLSDSGAKRSAVSRRYMGGSRDWVAAETAAFLEKQADDWGIEK